jgi:predicted nucleotidyltransferase
MKPANFKEVLPRFEHAGVKFILIGGGAGIAHGQARLTQDVDLVYSRDPENLKRIIDLLAEFQPYPRGAPAGLPFLWDVKTLQFGTNFTLSTTLGYIDLLGEVTGGGKYEDLLPYTEITTAYGVPVRVVTLERLIDLKRAAGRPKDFESVAELEALLEERERKSPDGV